MHPGDKAAVKFRAFLASTSFTAGVNTGPQAARIGQTIELGAVAGLGVPLPGTDLRIKVYFFEPVEHRLLFDVVQLLPAEVVLAAFHQRGAQVWVQLLQKGDIFVEELLL